mmetsp:Transcript_4080/g.9975  ORF Transcript_4080/g.9975 Transcript_4080/m.9975 type:complete len:200 (+) Transcript_4080:164-763(+)
MAVATLVPPLVRAVFSACGGLSPFSSRGPRRTPRRRPAHPLLQRPSPPSLHDPLSPTFSPHQPQQPALLSASRSLYLLRPGRNPAGIRPSAPPPPPQRCPRTTTCLPLAPRSLRAARATPGPRFAAPAPATPDSAEKQSPPPLFPSKTRAAPAPSRCATACRGTARGFRLRSTAPFLPPAPAGPRSPGTRRPTPAGRRS